MDNGSVESHRSIVESHAGWLYLEESQPGSYAARNRGLAAARGEILAFTDADCLPQQDWLAEGERSLAQALSLLSRKTVDLSSLITHTFPLDEIHAAFETAEKRLGGAIKVVVHPFATATP